MYVWRNAEVNSCNHCCSRKAINITYSESVFLASGIKHAMRMHHIVFCGLPDSTIFFHTVPYTVRFSKEEEKKNGKKVIEHKMRVLIFTVTFVWNISHSKKKWARYDKKRILGITLITCYSCPVLMELEFSWQLSKNIQKIETCENPFSASRADRRTDMMKLIVAFRNFANASKMMRKFKRMGFNSWTDASHLMQYRDKQPIINLCTELRSKVYYCICFCNRNIPEAGCGYVTAHQIIFPRFNSKFPLNLKETQVCRVVPREDKN
jgi:hypothetical protein